jgi:hypothetical protein
MAPVHAYKDKDYLHFVYVQVVDSHGFKTESGITLTANAGQLTISPLTATGPSVPMVEAASVRRTNGAAASKSPLLWLFVGGVAVLGLIALFAYKISQRKPAASEIHPRSR